MGVQEPENVGNRKIEGIPDIAHVLYVSLFLEGACPAFSHVFHKVPMARACVAADRQLSPQERERERERERESL